jgi:membrane protease YdiL (CAAX protease family)
MVYLVIVDFEFVFVVLRSVFLIGLVAYFIHGERDMIGTTFDWSKTKQLSVVQIFFAVFIPSTIAIIGFRGILPIMHMLGVPSIIGWPLVASCMLMLLVLTAIVFLLREAKVLGISWQARFCLKGLSAKEWLIYIGILLLGVIVTLACSQGSAWLTKISFLAVPDYFPFFLNPNIDPMKLHPVVLTPGFVLKGAYWLIPCIALTLVLNILAEELYFRAWLLPKMNRYKQAGWIINGVLFALYHSFQLWLLPQILPVSLFMAYVVYRSKSVWPALAIHIVVNSMTVLAMIMLIMS